MVRSVMKQTIELMSHTWATSGGGKVWLATNGSKWEETCYNWSDYGSILKAISNQPQGSDIYWTPLVFNSDASRKATNTNDMVGVLYVDMDRTDISYEDCFVIVPRPSFVWETSNSRWQAIWLLENTIQISTQQDANRRLAYHLKADTGAWDAARVLRVPGSLNYKRGGEQGKIVRYNPEDVFNIDDFDAVPNVATNHATLVTEGDMPALPSFMDWQILLTEQWDKIPLEARYWLSITDEQYKAHGVIDRSSLVTTVIRKLLKVYEPQIVFTLIWHAPWNKFITRPNTLWTQIAKNKVGV
jgi:hypothetical protein